MQDAVSTRKIPAFPPISVPSCWTVKKTSVQACGISTSLPNDQGIFPGAFPGCFVMLHDEGKRNPGQHSDAPPDDSDGAPSLALPRVRRLLRLLLHAALQIQNPQGGRNHARLLPGPFTSWKEDGKKQRPGLSINKQGTPAIMLFPAAEPIPSLKHAPGRQPGPGKVSGSAGGENRPSLRIPFPALFPGKPQIMAQRQRIRLAAFLPAMLFCHLRFPRLAQFHPGEPFKHLFCYG